MSLSEVALLLLAAFTGMFAVLMVVGLCKASSRKFPEPPSVLTAEERVQWDQIEQHWS